ncbi:MAG: helix-turn-helix transcriptional regulator [Pyrinomonadaceae bacterium]|nr:helix-turn-helix transcriptional regulator [Phycisphaerales bacterium]
MTVPRKRPLECPIEQCIAVLSGRWKAMILWRLFVEPLNYTALHAQMTGLSQRALSQALLELAQDGIIARTDDVWALTPLGEAIRPALSAMFAWGSLHQHAQARQIVPFPNSSGQVAPPSQRS